MAVEKQKVGNPSLLRGAIDRGLSGDKAGFPDPAAAPLGTDDEAAGTPNSREQVARSLAAEVGGRPADHEAHAAAKDTTAATASLQSTVPAGGGRRHRVAWLLAIAVALLVILAVVNAVTGPG
jgi:hypothetical protein